VIDDLRYGFRAVRRSPGRGLRILVLRWDARTRAIFLDRDGAAAPATV